MNGAALAGAAIIFDLDGTLVHSAPDLARAANLVLAEEERPALDLATVTSFVGNGVPMLVRRCLKATGGLPDEAETTRLLRRFHDHYDSDPTRLTRPYPGAIAALEALRAAGARLGLCTNKPETATGIVLERLNMADFFDTVVGGDTLAQRKPDPAPLLLSIERLGGGRALYLGDSVVDGQTAAAANVPLILHTEGYRDIPIAKIPHRASFSHFNQALTVIGKALD